MYLPCDQSSPFRDICFKHVWLNEWSTAALVCSSGRRYLRHYFEYGAGVGTKEISYSNRLLNNHWMSFHPTHKVLSKYWRRGFILEFCVNMWQLRLFIFSVAACSNYLLNSSLPILLFRRPAPPFYSLHKQPSRLVN